MPNRTMSNRIINIYYIALVERLFLLCVVVLWENLFCYTPHSHYVLTCTEGYYFFSFYERVTLIWVSLSDSLKSE